MRSLFCTEVGLLMLCSPRRAARSTPEQDLRVAGLDLNKVVWNETRSTARTRSP